MRCPAPATGLMAGLLLVAAAGPAAADPVGSSVPAAHASTGLGAVVGSPVGESDFNGDGFEDLAIGVPGEDLGKVRDAGAVNVLYGTSKGLRARGDQFWSQRSRGVPGKAERGDRFGSRLATGDFNGDGYADLIVESRGEDALKGNATWGAMSVLYGSQSGLTAQGARLWKAAAFPSRVDDSVGVGGLVYLAGDFDADGADDLAIGYDVQATSHPFGWVLWGGPSGLRGTMDTTTGTPLAVGDLTGDGIDDLVVRTCGLGCGIPWQLAPGSATAPLATLLAAPYDGRYLETSDHATGDLDADGREDLARIGTPGDGPPYSHLEQGVGTGGVEAPREVVSTDLGVPYAAIWHAQRAADVTGDGAADLAIALAGAPNGAVAVVLGTPGSGVLAQAAQIWTQATAGVKGSDEPEDQFARALRIGQFSARSHPDLAVGAPGENKGRGRVTVLKGTDTGLTAKGDRVWSQASKGVKGGAERGDQFGSSLG